MMRHLSKKHPAHNTLRLCWVGLFLTMALSTPSLLWADTPANAPTTVRPVSVRPIAVRPIPTPAPNIKRVVPTQGRRVRLQPIRNKKTLSRVLRERRQVPPVRRKTVVSNKVVKRLTREQLLRFRRLTDRSSHLVVTHNLSLSTRVERPIRSKNNYVHLFCRDSRTRKSSRCTSANTVSVF